MIHQATQAIADAFDEKKLRYTIEEYGNCSCVKARFSGDNISGLEVYFISDDEDNDVMVRALSICNVPKGKTAAMLRTINELHEKYRFMKLTLDGDGDVNGQYDFLMSNTEVGESACEAARRFLEILDNAYPKLMKTIYA